MAKPMKSLELRYPMIQFWISTDIHSSIAHNMRILLHKLIFLYALFSRVKKAYTAKQIGV